MPGIGEVKSSLGRLNQITGKGFTGSVTEGCDCMNYSWKLHTRGGGGRFFCEMCYIREFSRLKRCIRGGSLHFWGVVSFSRGGEGRGLVLSGVITFEDSQLLSYVLQG